MGRMDSALASSCVARDQSSEGEFSQSMTGWEMAEGAAALTADRWEGDVEVERVRASARTAWGVERREEVLRSDRTVYARGDDVNGPDKNRGGDVVPSAVRKPAKNQSLVVGEEEDVAIDQLGGAAEEGEEEGDGLEGGRLASECVVV